MKHNTMQVIYSEKINIRWHKFFEQKNQHTKQKCSSVCVMK